jgi:hypothetical protein
MRRCWFSIARFVGCGVAIGIAGLGLSSCFVPEAAPILGHDAKKRIFYDVVRGVQCEIRHAVLKELRDDKSSVWGKRKLAWLEGWAATMDLNLKIDNMVAFNPGVSLKTPNWLDAHVSRADGSTVTVGQSYAVGIGGGLSYDTTRYDKVQFAYEFSTFTKNGKEDREDQCYKIAGITVEGDLKLYDWLDDVLEPVRKCAFFGDAFNPFEDPPDQQLTPVALLSKAPEVSRQCAARDLTKDYSGKNSPIKGFHHDITFMLTFDANVTPMWNLVRISTTSSPLFDANRKDFSELLISLGPSDSKQVEAAHQALQIGSAVRN